MARMKESAPCRFHLPSATPIQMPSTCGTRTMSSSLWLPWMKVRWPALWCLSSHICHHSFPPPSMSIAHPTIIQFQRRVMHEAAGCIQNDFHKVYLPWRQFPFISLLFWFFFSSSFSALKPNFTLIYMFFMCCKKVSQKIIVTNPNTVYDLQRLVNYALRVHIHVWLESAVIKVILEAWIYCRNLQRSIPAIDPWDPITLSKTQMLFFPPVDLCHAVDFESMLFLLFLKSAGVMRSLCSEWQTS